MQVCKKSTQISINIRKYIIMCAGRVVVKHLFFYINNGVEE